jgi:hypothetical protein
MRINEITDPKHYITADADLANFLEQIEELRPDRIADGVPFPSNLAAKSKAMPIKRIGSTGGEVGSAHRRVHRSAQ